MQCDNDNSAASRLAAEVQRFRSRAHTDRRGPYKMIVSDFEFVYDMPSFRRYQRAEHDATNGWVRWPYHHICAGAWLQLEFRPGFETPAIGPVTLLTSDPFSEAMMVAAYLAAVTANPDCVLYSWGGEQKDWPVMRRFAMERGLVLPPQLVDLRPHAPSRIDLCNSTSGQARCTHLPEYAFSSGIPCKPLESKSIGQAVTKGRWGQVAEQVCADLLTTSIIAVRHAIAFGQCQADLVKTEQAIARAFAEALPISSFFATAADALSAFRALPLAEKMAG